MRFRARHRFHGPAEAVADRLADPRFYLELELPDLSAPELIEHHTSRDGTLVRLRYEFVGRLDPVARRMLGRRRLSWVQEVRVDSSSGSGSLWFGADEDSKRLHGSASFVLRTHAAETIRELEGELILALPGVRSMAERKIVAGLLRRLDIEAQALDDQLDRHS